MKSIHDYTVQDRINYWHEKNSASPVISIVLAVIVLVLIFGSLIV